MFRHGGCCRRGCYVLPPCTCSWGGCARGGGSSSSSCLASTSSSGHAQWCAMQHVHFWCALSASSSALRELVFCSESLSVIVATLNFTCLVCFIPLSWRCYPRCHTASWHAAPSTLSWKWQCAWAKGWSQEVLLELDLELEPDWSASQT